VRPFPLHNQLINIMTNAAKQEALEASEATLRGNFASPRNWIASCLDFQISKLEERCVDMRAEIDPKLAETNRNQEIWN
jgi:hypothetical protein